MTRQVTHGAHAMPTRMKSAMALAIALTLATVSAQAQTPTPVSGGGANLQTAINNAPTAGVVILVFCKIQITRYIMFGNIAIWSAAACRRFFNGGLPPLAAFMPPTGASPCGKSGGKPPHSKGLRSLPIGRRDT